MAQRFWRKAFSDLFKKDVSTAEESPERYLKLARGCMENLERTSSSSASSSLQFNHGQCQYLANNLRKALFEKMPSAWPSSSTIDVQGMEIMKLLWRCAKEVESFVLGCHRNNWVQAAFVLANATEYVCQLSADLEFCMLLIRNKLSNPFGNALRALDESKNGVFRRPERIKEIVSQDQMALLTRLVETVNPSSNSSKEETQLAQCLASRLSQHLSGSVELGCWEIQFSSLVPGQKLGGSAGVTVRKSKWMGEEVAEKVFKGADHATFRNEVQILAGLAHPNIVPLIGYAEDGNRCVIVMELMDGDLSGLMEDRLRQNPSLKVPFSDCEAVDMMLQTAEGMRYLHEKKVVHRDLKALNILMKCRKDVDGDQVVYAKVADFGLSKTKESSSSYSSLTANIGTTRWMAPELLPPGEDDLGARTSDQDSGLTHPFKVDIYSFGMVCYEILTGQVPFPSIRSLEVKKMVLKGKRPELPERCPKSLKQLIRSCWDAKPSSRPSFEEICRQLRHLKYLLMMCPSTIGSEPGTFEVIRAWELRVNIFGYKKDFDKKYRIGIERATDFGRFGRDFVAIDVMTSRAAAAVTRIDKMLMDRSENVQYVKREKGNLWLLSGHINIVDFYGAFEDDDYVYIVTELCEGGSLLDRIKAKGYYPEKDAVSVVTQMLKIVALWHGWGFVHRALQPEHFLFKSSEEDSTLKGTGFGLSDYIKLDRRFRDIVPDNIAYTAPEVLKGDFTELKSDMWSIGVITYMLLRGIPPFVADTEAGIRVKVLENKPGFEEDQWLSITSDAQDFVKKLLVTDTKERLTAQQALRHHWVIEANKPTSS